ncbi:unnamed protein product [Brugia timori]|uniref:Uncharacterized protein n=1 Tax=Brugia timori TaxID=42155 RepID=A0A0R3QUY6_9BILA|nr:unnamed protein product [Brugia timori]
MNGSIHSGRLLNESFDFDDLDAFNLLGLNFENFAEADESGYYSGDQLQNAVDRAFLFGFNGAFNRIEHGIDEMGNENRIHNVNNDDLLIIIILIYPSIMNCLHKNGGSLIKLILQSLQQFQHKFYEEINNEFDQMSDYLQHLKASGSRSWSPRSMRERHGRDFIEYRRHSYPNIVSLLFSFEFIYFSFFASKKF